MLRRAFVLWGLIGVASAVAQPDYPESDPTLTLETIAFGSCAKDREPQPIWSEIRRQQPDLFLFIGDNVYADTWIEAGESVSGPVQSRAQFDEAYARLGAQPDFQNLRAKTPLLAVWDDHDYGLNDGGKEYALRDVAQKAFWDFFGLPAAHPQRQQPGVYHARTFGPLGRQVQIILLDTRSFRDGLDWKAKESDPGRYQPTTDTSRSMLGETQWAWLEEQLRQPADLRLVISSIQILADEHGWEAWGTMPHERQRFFDLIEDTKAEGVIVLSGDRHMTEFTRVMGAQNAPMRYPLWDFTSSGMSDAVQEVTSPNRLRVGTAHKGSNFGLIHLRWSKQPGLAGLTITLESWALGDELVHRQIISGTDLMR